MKRRIGMGMATLGLLVLAGCQGGGQAQNNAPAPESGGNAPAVTVVRTGNELGKVKVGDQAVCAVCAHEPGHAPTAEEAKAVLDYKGKTYAFCSVDEKAQFISDPARYADPE